MWKQRTKKRRHGKTKEDQENKETTSTTTAFHADMKTVSGKVKNDAVCGYRK